jgi:methylmalonyl-CoA epimerase
VKAKRIDHIGIVVKDLATAVRTYEHNFGFLADGMRGGEVAALGIVNAFVPVGDADLEFIEPTTSDGPVAKFATERGEGTFMVSLEVEDLAAAVDQLRAAGCRVGDPQGNIAFVSMRSTQGVNLQLIQRG